MYEQKKMTFREALKQGKVKEDDYFSVKYPDYREVLFRLVKTMQGYVMWGPPTKEEILLSGEEGFKNLFNLANTQAKKEYFHPEAFEEVRACGLPENKYKINYNAELFSIIETAERMYKCSDDAEMYYTLASRYIHLKGNVKEFGVFFIWRNHLSSHLLGIFEGKDERMYDHPIVVRPEAIPKSNLTISIKEGNGSMERPWICLI